jgi:anaerobic selenocysteine-containing dehydrogenase
VVKAVRNVANWSPALFPPAPGELSEWEVLLRLTAIANGLGSDVDRDDRTRTAFTDRGRRAGSRRGGRRADSSTSRPPLLIGRRDIRSNNSWMHNLRVLTKGRERCTVQMHPDDAIAHGVSDGSMALVQSKVGEISVRVECTDSIMRGVVSIPQGGVMITTEPCSRWHVNALGSTRIVWCRVTSWTRSREMR